MNGADIALCVLSIPELLQDSMATRLRLPENISAMICQQDTLVLLNKSDLVSPETQPQVDNIVEQIKRTSKVDNVWEISINTRAGFTHFLNDFAEILRSR